MIRQLNKLFVFIGTYLCCFLLNGQVQTERVKDSMKTAFSLAEGLQARYKLVASTEKGLDVIKFAKQIDDAYYQGLAYNLIGINYETILEFNKAESSYKKALSFAQSANRDTLIGRIYNNLGNIYYMGYSDLDKSNAYYTRSIEIARKHNDLKELITPTLNIGWNYLDNKQANKALEYLQLSRGYLKETGDFEANVYIHYLFGIYHTQKGEFGQALENFNNAISIGEKLESYLELSDVYLAQSQMFEAMGDDVRKTKALENYYDYRSRVPDIESFKQLSIIEEKYVEEGILTDTDAIRDNTTDTPVNTDESTSGFFNKNRNWLIYSLLILLFGSALGIIIYRNNKSKKKLTEMLETRNEHLEEAKEEAEKLARLKSQFVSTVSHELRTPLYGVVGLTSLLLEENNLSSQENQYLKSLKFSGDYLLNLINDILNLSKIESNKIILEKRPFNIRDLVEDVINSFKFQLDQKSNKIHLHIDKKIPPFLKGDEVPLSQILINLIGNAIKFTSYGNIWIFLKLSSINENTAKINFIIKDDGPGIPKIKHDEIFENFSQLDRENNEYQGTGLGLSIVKKLIDLLKGEIKLVSDEGEGATFTFNLDFDVVKESNASIEKKRIEPTKLSEASIGKGYKVLIVEDNKINQIVTKNILIRESFECEVVDNGLSAIEYVKKDKFDLILMDLNMPLMSGIEASVKIREFNDEIPIVALTAVEIEDVKEDIDNAGIDDIINKPFDKNEFYKIILKNINSRKKKSLKTNNSA